MESSQMQQTTMYVIDLEPLKYNFKQDKLIHHGMQILESKDNIKIKLELK